MSCAVSEAHFASRQGRGGRSPSGALLAVECGKPFTAYAFGAASASDAHSAPTPRASAGLHRLTITGAALVNGKSGESWMWAAGVSRT